MHADAADLSEEQDVTQAYPDVLAILEKAVLGVAYPDPDVSDGQIELALDGLLRHYEAEARGRTFRPTRLGGRSREIFDVTLTAAEGILTSDVAPAPGVAGAADIAARAIDHALSNA